MEDALVRVGVVDTHGTVSAGTDRADDPSPRRQFARIANTTSICVFAALTFSGIWLLHLLRDFQIWNNGLAATLAATAVICLASGFGARAVRQRMERQIAGVAAGLTNTADRDLGAALDHLPEGVAIWDAQQRLIATNRKFRDTVPRMATALQPGVVFESSLETEIDAGYAPAGAEERLRARRQEQILGDRRPLLRNVDGRDYRIQEFPTESGGSITISTDVTAQRARERTIKDNEERNNIALLAANEGLWDLDLRSKSFFISPRALSFLDFKGDDQAAAEFRPKQWLSRIHPDDRKAYFDNWRQHLRGETTSFRAEYRIEDGQGDYRWIFDRALALRDSTGRAFRIGGSVTDISDQKATEQELQESRRQAELAGRSKTEFLANISHELRTPLHAIIGFADLLKAGDVDSGDYRDYAEFIHEAGGQLDRIVSELLDFSRADSGTLDLAESTVDLEALIGTVHTMLAPQASGKNMEFQLDLPSNLPPLIADAAKIQQALHHLLTNAIKYTPVDGRVLLEVRWTLSKGIRIDVHDNGKGMSEEEIERCLQPFNSARETLNRGDDGPGLGLAIVKSFVELHQGRLVIESEPGKGTTASIRLPAERLG